MNTFLKKTFFFLIALILFFALGLFIPTTPRASKSLLFASRQKEELLKNTPGPRIIFVGGSNLSFGLNSQMIKDSLSLNPINTGIHASIGLKYMLDNTIQYVKKGDIIVLIPEYSHFFRDYNFGSEELLRTIFDVNPSKIKLLNFNQLFNIISFVPKYTLSKLKPSEYFNVVESDIYSVNSFNKYGDAYAHWGKKREEFDAVNSGSGQLNMSVIKGIKEFQTEILKRKAVLLISYPGIQDLSYMKSEEQIKLVADEYNNSGFTILGNPKRYMIPDIMMFNTPYHLTKEGVDFRTVLFIEDFKKYQCDSL